MLVSITVDFDAATQSLDALRAAAYRLIGAATCEIAEANGRFICTLTASSKDRKPRYQEPESLRTDFLDLVTDENLRERIAARTDGIRNVILSLAFGHLASQGNHR